MASRLTVERTDYPLHIRAVDSLVGIADRLGAPFARLDQAHILEYARRRSGLHDFGDPAFLEPMSLVIDNAQKLGFTNLARVFIRASYIKAVVNRLKLVAELSRNPEISKTPLKRPIFIVGFPRTGTTLLQNLLAQAPGRRGLRFWELITPLPVSSDPAIDRRRRLRAADIALFAGNMMAPEMNEVHEIGSESYEECWYLFMNSFSVLNWDLQTGLQDYGRYLLDRDMTGAYEEYRTWLQVLLQNDPAEHLLLKCPEHLWFLDALLEVFPDACIVWTHRDPVVSIASYCSMMSLPRRMLFGSFDPMQVGQDIASRFHDGVTRAMAVRDKADPSRFYDVDFLELVKNPKQVAHDIAAHFDLSEPADMDARMAAWLAEERKDERGAHVYSADRYGINPDDIHERYAEYIERFSIPTKREHA